MNGLTKQKVTEIIQSDSVSLDDAWEWIGYSTKGNAMKKVRDFLEEDVDYKILLIQTDKQVHGGHNKQEVILTKDAFKELCMVARTDKGREVRRYFIEIEKQYSGQSHKDKFQYHMMQALAELGSRVEANEQRQRQLEASYRKRVLTPQLSEPEEEYYSIKGWVSLTWEPEDKRTLKKADYMSMGKQATKISKQMLKEIKFVIEDGMTVNMYSDDVLRRMDC